MAAPQTPYEAVLNAARDVAKLDCALDAEMLGTALMTLAFLSSSSGHDHQASHYHQENDEE